MIYLNSNSINSNPDIGFAANYNDGVYHHTGFFRDHTTGVWKVFDGYLPEPDASPFIDQSNNSFNIAPFQANNIYVGNTTSYGTITATSFSGTSNNSTYLNGQLASYYTNANNITTGTLPDGRLSSAVVNTSGNFTVAGNLNFTGTNNYFSALFVGANTVVNTTALFTGNSTVNTNITSGQISISGVTVNSTIYQGTANNANNLNGQSASYYTNATNISTGTLSPSVGGTGLNSYAVGDIIVASGSTTLSKLSIGTNGYVLQSNGTSLVYGTLDGGSF
jgi:hypothetical protein